MILRNKRELMGESTLQRTSTPPPAVKEVNSSGCFGLCPSGTEPKPEQIEDMGTPLMRTQTPPINRMDAMDDENSLTPQSTARTC